MKLTIEHLAVYPMDEDTGLLIQTKLRKATRSGQPLGYYTGRLIGVSKRGSGVEIVFDKDDFSEDYDVEEIKPVLRPLSDLNKKEYYNYLCHSTHLLIDKQGVLHYKWADSIPYFDFKKLLDWHFDVFGLIYQHLAIDINTLES